MIDIRFDHHQATLEIEVYDRYETTDLSKTLEAYLEMARQHPQFYVLETVHKGWGNWIVISTGMNTHLEELGVEAEEFARLMKRLKKYAIVSDRKIMAGLYSLILRMSGTKSKVFSFSEQYNARLWLAGQYLADS
ncbi:MAG: STAS/SEC14 domain-containing protein [Aquisalinus sp.]|nr:STAS/SEC14 domain-containing protein [Aquisalinus sp.]